MKVLIVPGDTQFRIASDDADGREPGVYTKNVVWKEVLLDSVAQEEGKGAQGVSANREPSLRPHPVSVALPETDPEDADVGSNLNVPETHIRPPSKEYDAEPELLTTAREEDAPLGKPRESDLCEDVADSCGDTSNVLDEDVRSELASYTLPFQHQERARCGKHAINNALALAGEELVTNAEMTAACDAVIAESLIPDANGVVSDPQIRANHEDRRNGWYSAAVLEMVLRRTLRFELRLGFQLRADVNVIYAPEIVGAVVNQHGRHWVALKVVHDVIWLLDSCHEPRAISEAEYHAYVTRYPHAYPIKRL